VESEVSCALMYKVDNNPTSINVMFFMLYCFAGKHELVL
jgi:hypothetical protein